MTRLFLDEMRKMQLNPKTEADTCRQRQTETGSGNSVGSVSRTTQFGSKSITTETAGAVRTFMAVVALRAAAFVVLAN